MECRTIGNFIRTFVFILNQYEQAKDAGVLN